MSMVGRLQSYLGQPGQRISWSVLAGYDLFISYRRSDAKQYATALFEALRRADFRCFLDDNDATPGKPLTSKLLWALNRSKVLLVVASPDLHLSTWVPQEVEIFARSKRCPSSDKYGILASDIEEALGHLLIYVMRQCRDDASVVF